MRRLRLVAVLLAGLLVATACEPVSHVVEPDAWQFEGFTVYSHVPDDPVGIVYVFHGTGGSAEFGNKVETIDQLNELVERGYGWVSTESTERTGNKRWDVFDPSLTTNPDLSRLARLHARLVDDTGIEPETPIFGIGMSNGARMVTLFGQVFANEGYPVAAVAPFMGEAAPLVNLTGGLTVPAFWVIAENDTVVDNDAIRADQRANAATGATSVIAVKREEALTSLRFLRIPAIDQGESEAIRDALVATGAWDTSGTRLVEIDDIPGALAGLAVPASFGASDSDVRSQIQAMLALHQFVGAFRHALADFFDAQL
ncbi:MAG: hypothetical protein R2707_02400 [Acidimicrobiales bacterium]